MNCDPVILRRRHHRTSSRDLNGNPHPRTRSSSFCPPPPSSLSPSAGRNLPSWVPSFLCTMMHHPLVSWSNQHHFIHIHLTFLLLITASVWTYCSSESSAQDLYQSSPFHPNHKQTLPTPSLGVITPSSPLPPGHGAPSTATPSPPDQKSVSSYPFDGSCTRNRCRDRAGFEAIQFIHNQLDVDDDGDIEFEETQGFLTDELNLSNSQDRQKAFHGNDHHISVEDLWKTWKLSRVHNWTQDEVIDWLTQSVQLPQYTKAFFIHEVTGSFLPVLASNTSYLQNMLKIKDPIHRQKIALKAMEVVLFGPPYNRNRLKDMMLATSLALAIGGCWFAFVQKKASQIQIQKMLKDMDSLSKAESSLSKLQHELEEAKSEQGHLLTEKQRLEQKLAEKITTSSDDLSSSLPNLHEYSRIMELEQQIHELRDQLSQRSSWSPPRELQLWLQLTHELELRHYNAKRAEAEGQMAATKDACEKLRKKRGAFMGSFRVAHGSSLDEIDNRIAEAKAALSEVTRDLTERLTRWKNIESLISCPIVKNGGIESISSALLLPPHHPSVSSGSNQSTGNPSILTRSNSEGTINEGSENDF